MIMIFSLTVFLTTVLLFHGFAFRSLKGGPRVSAFVASFSLSYAVTLGLWILAISEPRWELLSLWASSFWWEYAMFFVFPGIFVWIQLRKAQSTKEHLVVVFFWLLGFLFFRTIMDVVLQNPRTGAFQAFLHPLVRLSVLFWTLLVLRWVMLNQAGRRFVIFLLILIPALFLLTLPLALHQMNWQFPAYLLSLLALAPALYFSFRVNWD